MRDVALVDCLGQNLAEYKRGEERGVAVVEHVVRAQVFSACIYSYGVLYISVLGHVVVNQMGMV